MTDTFDSQLFACFVMHHMRCLSWLKFDSVSTEYKQGHLHHTRLGANAAWKILVEAVTSLSLLSPSAATDGVTLFFPQKSDDLCLVNVL